jgi:hypothetical protein
MSSPASSWIALEQCWKSIRDISELVMQLTIFEDELCRNKYCLATAVSVLACILLLIVLYSRCIGRAPHFVFYSRQNWPCPTLCILLPAKLAVPHTLYSTLCRCWRLPFPRSARYLFDDMPTRGLGLAMVSASCT